MPEHTPSTPPPQRHDPVLCFVRPPWAFFSFVPCDDPSLAGNGWDEPYNPEARNITWHGDVLRVAFAQADLLTPRAMVKPFEPGPSPSAINASRGGWLFSFGGDVVAHAGMPLSVFREVIRARGAEVLEPTWPGRPAFDPSEPAKGSPRLSVPDATRRPAEHVEVLLESVFKESGLDLRVARRDTSELSADVPDVAICRVVVDGHGGNITFDPYSAAIFAVGLSRFVARSRFDWGRLGAETCVGKTVGYTIDGLEAHVISTADPAENARRLAAAWNEVAGYGPGEGARAEGAEVIWPETTRHPVHAQREAAAAAVAAPALPAETSEPPKEDERDVVEILAQNAHDIAQRGDLRVFYPSVVLAEPLFFQEALDRCPDKGVVFYYFDKGTHYRIIAERVVPPVSPVSPTQVTNLALEQQMAQACGEDGAIEVAARIIAATSRQEGDGSCSES